MLCKTRVEPAQSVSEERDRNKSRMDKTDGGFYPPHHADDTCGACSTCITCRTCIMHALSSLSSSPVPRALVPQISYRLVLDTNIVMDLLYFSDPGTVALANGLADGRLQCFTDAECLAELERVAAYPEFRLETAEQKALLARYRQLAQRCETTAPEIYALPQCRDPDDQKFLVLAIRCRADLLLTRDKALLQLAHFCARHPLLPARRRPTYPQHRLPFSIATAAEAATLLRLAPENPASGI